MIVLLLRCVLPARNVTARNSTAVRQVYLRFHEKAPIIIGFLDASDAQHRRAIEVLKAWLSAGDVVLIPVSVYAEILVWPLRRGVDGTVDAFIAESGLRVVPLTADIARQAANLRAKHASLRLPDALALATAVTHGASFLTLDHSLQRIFDDLSSRA